MLFFLMAYNWPIKPVNYVLTINKAISYNL